MNLQTIFHTSCTSLHPHQKFTMVIFLPHPYQHLCLLIYLIIDILTGVTQCLTVVLIGNSPMINDIEQLFVGLLAICMSSLEKCLFRSFTHYFIWVICWVLSLICMYSLYTWGINSCMWAPIRHCLLSLASTTRFTLSLSLSAVPTCISPAPPPSTAMCTHVRRSTIAQFISGSGENHCQHNTSSQRNILNVRKIEEPAHQKYGNLYICIGWVKIYSESWGNLFFKFLHNHVPKICPTQYLIMPAVTE